jgi:hypothetical protein
MRIPAKILVRGLYLAFRNLTGLRASRLPDHAAALSRAGFSLTSQHISLFGMLTTELWLADRRPSLRQDATRL